jgi:hypothetical protein
VATGCTALGISAKFIFMTACSNHPATLRGADLQRLVAAVERLYARLIERVGVVASRYGIDYEAYVLLDQLMNDAGHREERGLGLLRAAGLVTGEIPQVLVTTEGIKAYAAINQARFDWLDAAARELDGEALRAATELLRQLKP